MYKLKESAKKKFNPYFNTAINGIPVRVSIKDMETNPQKYVNTPLVDFYQDAESIKDRIVKSKKASARKVNMNGVSRGLIFKEGHKTVKEQAVEDFLELQKKTMAKLKKRNAAKAKAEAATKAKPTAKKTASKAKKSAPTAEEKAIEEALKKAND